MEWQPAPSAPLSLPPGEVHIWRFGLEVQPEVLVRLSGWLDTDEIARAARFYQERDRRRFTARRGMLRQVLAGYLNAAPESLRFTNNEYGRPALDGVDGLDFNASHSGEYGLLAVARGAQVGVDIERQRPDADLAAIARRFFSPVEQAQLFALPAAQQTVAFFLCWTRKEAYIKTVGSGLSIPLDQFDVSLKPNEPARLMAARGGLPGPESLQLKNLEPAEGWAAALCLPVGEWRVRLWYCRTTP